MTSESETTTTDSEENRDASERIRTLMSPASNEDKVVCRECYEPFGQITASHLSLHGMTTEEYREEHPDAPLQSEAVKEAGGWSDDHHGPETRAAISDSISEKHENGDYTDARQG